MRSIQKMNAVRKRELEAGWPMPLLVPFASRFEPFKEIVQWRQLYDAQSFRKASLLIRKVLMFSVDHPWPERGL
jgi:hypothetical protein